MASLNLSPESAEIILMVVPGEVELYCSLMWNEDLHATFPQETLPSPRRRGLTFAAIVFMGLSTDSQPVVRI